MRDSLHRSPIEVHAPRRSAVKDSNVSTIGKITPGACAVLAVDWNVSQCAGLMAVLIAATARWIWLFVSRAAISISAKRDDAENRTS